MLFAMVFLNLQSEVSCQAVVLSFPFYFFLQTCLISYSRDNAMSSDNRSLASADEETRERVARKGGEASHDERGLQAADQETRERVARAGGEASGGGNSSNQGQGGGEGRGFAGMSEEERKRIASKGGQK
jgi:general stress protein YciG